jgi:hypothetical protein
MNRLCIGMHIILILKFPQRELFAFFIIEKLPIVVTCK